MTDPRVPLLRRLLPWTMIGAYALAIVLAGRSVFAIRDAQTAAAADQIVTTLQDAVAAWEELLLVELTEWMDAVALDPARAMARQTQLRRRAPWFDSVYVWVPPRRVTVGRDTAELAAQVLFPRPSVEDDIPPLARLCIHRARMLASDPRQDPSRVAQGFMIGCPTGNQTTRIMAATGVGEMFKNRGLNTPAMQALNTAEVPDDLTLQRAALEGIPPLRLTLFRLQQAELLALTDDEDQALDLYEDVGLQVAALDAPEAKNLLQLLPWPIIAKLRRGDRNDQANRVAAALGQATRRVDAWRELNERIVTQVPTPGLSEAPRFIRDQYSSAPFVLFFGWIRDRGVALQLEQNVLISSFLGSKTVSRLRRHLTITDESGTLVAGTREGGPLALEVRFQQTLNHLSVGIRQSAIDASIERVEGQWYAQLATVFVTAFLGFVAMVAQIRAGRQQSLLIRRQREFTTRVTHELKTPLAGIRVMAENVEAGTFRSSQQLEEMARRIINETDRLTQRVDEVLAAARRRAVPDPRPFDPEEPLLEAIDTWGPRLEAGGVTLMADLAPTDEVLGDAGAIRDAVACLLDNALKYRRADRTDSQCWLDLNQSGRTVEIRVRDNGLGVPADQREAVFERFVRVEGANRGMAGGYGLGLAQVADIARSHGGRVRCEAGPDGGASFILTLPTIQADGGFVR